MLTANAKYRKMLKKRTWSAIIFITTHMKLLIICLVSSELLELAKLMKEQ